MAWGGTHHSITAAAYGALRAWQQDIWAAQRAILMSRYCLIPDIAGLPGNRIELLPFQKTDTHRQSQLVRLLMSCWAKLDDDAIFMFSS